LFGLRREIPCGGEVPGDAIDDGRANGWVKDDAERQARVRELERQLVGRRIVRVRYVEIRYADADQPAEPQWGLASFDSLDYWLELDLDDHSTWCVEWQQAGDNESLRPAQGMTTWGHDGPAVWDVTQHWNARGPRSIASVTPVWMRLSTKVIWPKPSVRTADICLITLILSSGAGREAVITLGEHRDGGYTAVHDNLAVFFSVADARQAGVSLPGDHD
jgi:hypothetical protein